jgi:transcriptional antiterminator RfaH
MPRSTTITSTAITTPKSRASKGHALSPESPSAAAPAPNPAWFCLRSQPKHEHIAAARLRELSGLEVFLPRIRFRRKTRRGVDWVTEALFPNYLFARFDWHRDLRRVHHSPGISNVVHFGHHWPTLPDAAMAELRRLCGDEELHVVPATLQTGDAVEIAGGVFHGLSAVVTQVLPARQRVSVLLDFLGRQLTVELSQDEVLREGNAREGALGENPARGAKGKPPKTGRSGK